MRDDIPKTHTEVQAVLSGRGSLSFDMPAARRKQFALNIQRQKRSLIYWLARKKMGTHLQFLRRNFPNVGLTRFAQHGTCFLVYQTAHSAIETIEGEDIDGGIIRVTLVGRP